MAASVLGLTATSASAAGPVIPNDTSFGNQWGDRNTGQLIPRQQPPKELEEPLVEGLSGADDRLTEAWGITTGSPEIVVAVLDTGVDYTNANLAGNIWTNPTEVGGCAKGDHGYNALFLLPTERCNPMDREVESPPSGYGGHGTHVAGIIGAVGNTGSRVAGVNWHTTILPVRWAATAGTGEREHLINSIEWLVAVKKAGVNIRVANLSLNFANPEQEHLKEAIEKLTASNILVVTAAGNTPENSYFPCEYGLPDVICVTASNNRDEIPPWAKTGGHVDLAAPGESIYSTLLEGNYGYLSGSSMAAAQVSGAAALILSVAPNMSPGELKADILNNVHPVDSMKGRVTSGGRLDICKALPGCPPPPPPPPPPAPPPSPPPPPPVQPSSITLTSTWLKVSHDKTKVGLRCVGATACISKLALTVKVRTRVGHGTRTSFTTNLRMIGTARFSVGPEGVVQVTVKLNAWGRRLVRLGNGRLSTTLTVFASQPAPATTQKVRIRLTWRRKRGR